MKKFWKIKILKILMNILALKSSTNIYDGESDIWNAACIKVNSIKEVLKKNNVLVPDDQLIFMKIHHFYRSLMDRDIYRRLNVTSRDFEGCAKDEHDKKVTIKFSYCNDYDDYFNYHIEELFKNPQNVSTFTICDITHKYSNRHNYKLESKESIIKAPIFIFKHVKKLNLYRFCIKIYDKDRKDKNTFDFYESICKLKKRTEKDIKEVIKTYIDEINNKIKSKLIKERGLKFYEKRSPFNDFGLKKIVRSLVSTLESILCNENNLLFELITIRFDKNFNLTFIINNYIYIDNNFQNGAHKHERLIMVYNGTTYRYIMLGSNNREKTYQLEDLIQNRSNFIYSYVLNLITYHIDENLEKKDKHYQEYKNMLEYFVEKCNQRKIQDTNTTCKNLCSFLNESFFDKVLIHFDALVVDLKIKTIMSTEDVIFISAQQPIMIINKRKDETIRLDFNNFNKKYGKADSLDRYSHFYFDIFINDNKIDPNLLREEEFKKLKETIEKITNQWYIPKILNSYEDYKGYKFCYLSSDTTCETYTILKENIAYYFISNRITDPKGKIKLYHFSEIDITFFKQNQNGKEDIKEEYYDEIVSFINGVEESVENVISLCFHLNNLKEEDNIVLIPMFFTYIPFLGIKITKYDKLENRLISLFYISQYEILITNYKKRGFEELYLGMYMRNPETIKQVPSELDKLVKKIKILMHCESLKVMVKKDFDMNDLKSLSKSAFENNFNIFKEMIVVKKRVLCRLYQKSTYKKKWKRP